MFRCLIFVALFAGNLIAAEPASYTWWDGDNESKVWVDPTRVAKLEYAKDAKAGTPPRVTLIEVTHPVSRASLAKGKIPPSKRGNEMVFRNAPEGGQRFVAIGSVIVRFAPNIDEKTVGEMARKFQSQILQKVDVEPNTYLLSSPSGVKALQAANAWKSEPGVNGAEPTWWRENSPR